MFIRNIKACVCKKHLRNYLLLVVIMVVLVLILENMYVGLARGKPRSFVMHDPIYPLVTHDKSVPLVIYDEKHAHGRIRQVCTGPARNCDKLNLVFKEISKDNGKFNESKSVPPLFDFDKQPCVTVLIPSQELSNQGGCVRTLKREASELISGNDCVNLKIAQLVTPVCIYDNKKDMYISASLRSTGTWERNLMLGIVQLLDSHTDSIFLDLGCNIGAFTLAAAKSHKRVVAVDPLLANLELLSKSLHLGNLTENVTLVWNAVSLERSTVTLTKYEGNVGGTAIKGNASVDDSINDSVNTIKLDDIKEIFLGKPTIIKMDVETQELNTLRSGELFFQTVDVRVVLMEYNWHRNRLSGVEIITFMDSRGFKPYTDSRAKFPLNVAERQKWPGEVFFLKT